MMSVELEDAKKKVAEFQKQCEEYLVIIVQQKREADEQQKVGASAVSCPLKALSHRVHQAEACGVPQLLCQDACSHSSKLF